MGLEFPWGESVAKGSEIDLYSRSLHAWHPARVLDVVEESGEIRCVYTAGPSFGKMSWIVVQHAHRLAQRGTKSSAKLSKWNCIECSMENDGEATSCGMCYARKPKPGDSSAPALRSTPSMSIRKPPTMSRKEMRGAERDKFCAVCRDEFPENREKVHCDTCGLAVCKNCYSMKELSARPTVASPEKETSSAPAAAAPCKVPTCHTCNLSASNVLPRRGSSKGSRERRGSDPEVVLGVRKPPRAKPKHRRGKTQPTLDASSLSPKPTKPRKKKKKGDKSSKSRKQEEKHTDEEEDEVLVVAVDAPRVDLERAVNSEKSANVSVNVVVPPPPPPQPSTAADGKGTGAAGVGGLTVVREVPPVTPRNSVADRHGGHNDNPGASHTGNENLQAKQVMKAFAFDGLAIVEDKTPVGGESSKLKDETPECSTDDSMKELINSLFETLHQDNMKSAFATTSAVQSHNKCVAASLESIISEILKNRRLINAGNERVELHARHLDALAKEVRALRAGSAADRKDVRAVWDAVEARLGEGLGSSNFPPRSNSIVMPPRRESTIARVVNDDIGDDMNGVDAPAWKQAPPSISEFLTHRLDVFIRNEWPVLSRDISESVKNIDWSSEFVRGIACGVAIGVTAYLYSTGQSEGDDAAM